MWMYTSTVLSCGALHPALPSLQKQVGCFNHRVVTLVADKLERHLVVMRGSLWY